MADETLADLKAKVDGNGMDRVIPEPIRNILKGLLIDAYNLGFLHAEVLYRDE